MLGDKKHPLPKQRGFDRSFGLLNAADSYWNPKSLILEDVLIDVETTDFHLTDAITDHAVNQITESVELGSPFFQYVAFTAPYWPLHAWEDDIVKYEGKYMAGYDAIRTARHEEQKGLGVVMINGRFHLEIPIHLIGMMFRTKNTKTSVWRRTQLWSNRWIEVLDELSIR